MTAGFGGRLSIVRSAECPDSLRAKEGGSRGHSVVSTRRRATPRTSGIGDYWRVYLSAVSDGSPEWILVVLSPFAAVVVEGCPRRVTEQFR